jgi:hypothetical protein
MLGKLVATREGGSFVAEQVVLVCDVCGQPAQ